MPILLLDLVLGAALVTTVALATRARVGRPVRRWRAVGWLLIAIPLPLVVGLQVFMPLPPGFGESAFVAGVAAFACGALLVLGSEDDDRPEGGAEPGDPPWWPDFERDFRAYAARRSRPRVLR